MEFIKKNLLIVKVSILIALIIALLSIYRIRNKKEEGFTGQRTFINEIGNDGTSDYIEVYDPIDQYYYTSDRFPTLGSFSVVIGSREPIHINRNNFSRNGDFVVFRLPGSDNFATQGVINVSDISGTYSLNSPGATGTGWSYGRSPDGSNNLEFMMETPGEPNQSTTTQPQTTTTTTQQQTTTTTTQSQTTTTTTQQQTTTTTTQPETISNLEFCDQEYIWRNATLGVGNNQQSAVIKKEDDGNIYYLPDSLSSICNSYNDTIECNNYISEHLSNEVLVCSGRNYFNHDNLCYKAQNYFLDNCRSSPNMVSNVGIALGGSAGAALKFDGSVVLWGDVDQGGYNNTGVDLTNVKAISMGYRAGAALKYDGSVVLWGDRHNGGSFNDGFSYRDIDNPVRAISMGGHAGAALKQNGEVILWGDRNNGGSNNTNVDLTNVKAISMGYRAGAALKENGTVVLWGNRYYGGFNNTNVNLENVKAISMGGGTGAALKHNGSVVLWGNEYHGGSPFLYRYDSINDRYNIIGSRIDLTNVKAISMGGLAGAAVKHDGTVILWGHEKSGGFNNTNVDLTNVKAIYMGGNAGAALKNDGSVVLWGHTIYGGSPRLYTNSVDTIINTASEIRYYNNFDSNIATRIQTSLSSGVLDISMGDRSGIALKDNGSIILWGYDNNFETTNLINNNLRNILPTLTTTTRPQTPSSQLCLSSQSNLNFNGMNSCLDIGFNNLNIDLNSSETQVTNNFGISPTIQFVQRNSISSSSPSSPSADLYSSNTFNRSNILSNANEILNESTSS